MLRNNSVGTWDQDTTNPSPFPLHSPSDPTSAILLAYRGCPYNCDGSELLALTLAPNFTGPYTRLSSTPLLPSHPNEDPFIWRDKRGHFHMLTHSLEEGGGFGDGPKVGRHAYARGLNEEWRFNNVTLAYNWTVEREDGKGGVVQVDYFRRERPQLYFSEDGQTTPLYLSNGVQERGSSQSYTLIQPLAGAKAYEEQLGFRRTAQDHRHQRVRTE